MLIIAHRGNIFGPDREQNPYEENTMESIAYAINHGYGVEIDLWDVGGYLWLGHDDCRHSVMDTFLVGFHEKQDLIYVHCKNIAAMEACKDLGIRNYFSHDRDPAVLTSNGYLWTYPDKKNTLNKYSIPVVFNRDHKVWPIEELKKCYAICTDDAAYFRSVLCKDEVE